jgi:ubiquinone/menaquinone biosynthesis C-methylase UbiE
MSGPLLLKHLAREVLSWRTPQRTPEPVLLMDDPAQVDGYERAGHEDGPMLPTYLLHTLHLCQMIRPGEQVVDLACGPANLLCQVARLNPRAQFLGIDLAGNMLRRAQDNAQRQELTNIRFMHGDITRVAEVANRSADLVMSTLSLHHLPDTGLLEACFDEIARIVKPGGAVYLADLGRLKHEATVQFVASWEAERHPPLYTIDFLNSMRAAFPVQTLRQASRRLTFLPGLKLLHTFLVPFMVVIKTPARHALPSSAATACRQLWQNMSPSQQGDFEGLRRFFGWGGLRSPHPSA